MHVTHVGCLAAPRYPLSDVGLVDPPSNDSLN
jgi:hypothetical protein